jgi:CheY-like chemotaxis protein
MADASRVVLLAIDDEPDNLRVVSTALAQSSLEILTAADPVQGWELVRQRRPNIVMTDLVMPGMTGMQLLERIVDFDPVIP